jgi:hypothetical protein
MVTGLASWSSSRKIDTNPILVADQPAEHDHADHQHGDQRSVGAKREAALERTVHRHRRDSSERKVRNKKIKVNPKK